MSLSDGAERLFWRLIAIADDYGRFEADIAIVLSRCYPLAADRRRLRQIAAHCRELEKAQCIQFYSVDGSDYGEFVNWAKYQRSRAKFSKYPPPIAATCGDSRQNAPDLRPSTFDTTTFDTTIANNGQPSAERRPYGEFSRVRLTELEHEKLITRLGVELANTLITDLDREMEAGGGKLTNGRKVVSAYATILKWADRRPKDKHPPPANPDHYRDKSGTLRIKRTDQEIDERTGRVRLFV